MERGHSRIPVYSSSRENIVGLLMAKTLIPINPNDEVAIKDLIKFNLLTVFMKDPLFNLLNKFQTGKSKSSRFSTLFQMLMNDLSAEIYDHIATRCI